LDFALSLEDLASCHALRVARRVDPEVLVVVLLLLVEELVLLVEELLGHSFSCDLEHECQCNGCTLTSSYRLEKDLCQHI
ncbi:hypothetical protein PIB30_106746, partial [Stylosanthes scabra]|nr:hypothetical protein [Stylosanthes scabra]